MIRSALVISLIFIFSGCSTVTAPLPPLVDIPLRGLAAYGASVDEDVKNYDDWKHHYEQNDCVKWDRYIHAMLEVERKKYPNDSDIGLTIRACRSNFYDCSEPPISQELKDLITRTGMPSVHCYKPSRWD